MPEPLRERLGQLVEALVRQGVELALPDEAQERVPVLLALGLERVLGKLRVALGLEQQDVGQVQEQVPQVEVPELEQQLQERRQQGPQQEQLALQPGPSPGLRRALPGPPG